MSWIRVMEKSIEKAWKEKREKTMWENIKFACKLLFMAAFLVFLGLSWLGYFDPVEDCFPPDLPHVQGLCYSEAPYCERLYGEAGNHIGYSRDFSRNGLTYTLMYRRGYQQVKGLRAVEVTRHGPLRDDPVQVIACWKKVPRSACEWTRQSLANDEDCTLDD
jgi:hypothetical protein